MRQGEAFYKDLESPNQQGGVYQSVKTTGVKTVSDPNPTKYVSEVERDVFVPKTPDLAIASKLKTRDVGDKRLAERKAPYGSTKRGQP